MIEDNVRINKQKVGLLNLAEELDINESIEPLSNSDFNQ
jgi:hypothetical protein